MQLSTEQENILSGNLWVDKKTPPLEYCSFERASRLLECEMDDLLHLYEIGAFNIAFKSDGLAVRYNVNFSSKTQKLETDLIHPVLTNQSLGMEFSTIWYDLKEESIEHFENGFQIIGFACGIWYADDVISEIKNGLAIDSDYEVKLKPVNIRDNVLMATAIYEGNKDIEIPFEDLLIMRRDLELIWKSMRTGIHLPSIFTKRISPEPQIPKRVNNTAEHHAKNREGLLNAAIYILAKYPSECRGERKEISPEKWTNSIIKHLGELPPLFITNEQEILRKLRLAVNHAGLKKKG
ncbi:hypothetical protein KJ097_001060 [Salmonella enterica]|nr:hypothetical protein [Salmonella enterica]